MFLLSPVSLLFLQSCYQRLIRCLLSGSFLAKSPQSPRFIEPLRQASYVHRSIVARSICQHLLRNVSPESTHLHSQLHHLSLQDRVHTVLYQQTKQTVVHSLAILRLHLLGMVQPLPHFLLIVLRLCFHLAYDGHRFSLLRFSIRRWHLVCSHSCVVYFFGHLSFSSPSHQPSQHL